MRKILTRLFFLIFLTSCSTTHLGNSIAVSKDFNRVLAEDSLTMFTALYTPAQTKFYIKQSVKDAYGKHLIAVLRLKGYGILEAKRGSNISSAKSLVPLSYLLDKVAKGNLYRLTVIIGNRSLSRAYGLKNGLPYPLGFWVRRE